MNFTPLTLLFAVGILGIAISIPTTLMWRYKRTAEALKRLNETLAAQVQAEEARNLAQERLLIRQSRQAAMGAMISNIAHQWRQPINALTLLLGNIKEAYEYGELTKEYLTNEVKTGQELIRKMSGAIDDFRNFFQPDEEKQRFNVCDPVEATIKLVGHSFKNGNIEIVLDKNCASQHRALCVAFGYPNEFAQVVLNVLSNAKNAIVARKIAGKVHIKVEQKENVATVAIHDNGGGVSEEILDKIFDLYFTTKDSSAGIGLYMSKTIMRNMNGDITLRNADDGAEVLITLPTAESVARRDITSP
jgi:signal transduction histidine kinase